MAGNATGVVQINSELIRKGWMLEGMIQEKSKSWWAPLTGMSRKSVVYQVTDFGAGNGHTVVFDYSGNLAGEGFEDKEQAYGKGESKRKFSDKLIVKRVRYAADNGDEYDAVNIGDLELSLHSNARELLSDLWSRNKDQWLFDAGQGRLNSVANTHVIRPNDKATIGDLVAADILTYDFLWDLEEKMKIGEGFAQGGKRRPLEAYQTSDGETIWLFAIDPTMKRQLIQDGDMKTIMASADVRGSDNLLIKGQLGKMGSLLIVEAPRFFGASSARTPAKTKTEICGLRLLDSAGLYYGETGYGAGGTVVASRGLLLGAGALQLGIGKMPEYRWQSSQDFGIDSESAVISWVGVQKTKLVAEDVDYIDAKVAGLDYGVIAVDVFNAQK
ncbi:MAG: hypothetical protein DRQ78_11475 [Epsilonproteobacteria bacterium]|nr:MAG: hypothetical protein DRQ78_11475 [Campylobacterota bacterium]